MNEHYRTIFENVADGLVIHCPDSGDIVDANSSFCDLTGYDREQLVGEPSETVVADGPSYLDDLDDEELVTIRRDGAAFDEWELTRASGVRFFAQVHIALVEFDGRERILANVRDVTERKRQSQRFQALLENAMAIIAVFQPDGTIEYVSPSVERFLGYDQASILGDTITSYVHEDDRAALLERLRVAEENPGEPVRGEERLHHANGNWRVFESVANSQLDNPAIEGIVVNARDITGRRERDNQLKVLDRLLRHNIRNDMNVVQGTAELMAEHGDETVVDAAERILHMTDELLETVEKEREIVDVLGGRTSVRHFDLVDLLRRAAATVDSSSHPDIRLDLPPTAQVCARPEIERGLQELLENALEHGSATVTVTVEQSESTTVVEIRDDGPGIPDTETAAIEEGDIDALSHGSGMGLWLVSYIVSESGGTLEFDTGSTGTTVCVTLPRT